MSLSHIENHVIELAYCDSAFNFANFLIDTGFFDNKLIAGQLIEYFADQDLPMGTPHALRLLDEQE